MGEISKIYGWSEILRKTGRNLILLNCFFIASLITANVVAGKVIMIFGLTVPAAVVAYPWTFLCTDIIGELWGREEANRTVKTGILIQVFSMALIYGAIALPVAPFASEMQGQFQAVLGSSLRFVCASLCAYMISQWWDVTVFHRIKDWTGKKHKWLRNNASTMTSQLIDTAIFITIGFYGAVPDLLAMVVSQYIVKLMLALMDTPLFYYFTRPRER